MSFSLKPSEFLQNGEVSKSEQNYLFLNVFYNYMLSTFCTSSLGVLSSTKHKQSLEHKDVEQLWRSTLEMTLPKVLFRLLGFICCSPLAGRAEKNIEIWKRKILFSEKQQTTWNILPLSK